MTGNIFINYRREESSHVAGRLHDSLALKFGREKLFMDVDNIPVGRDFEDYLNSQVAACDAMLAIIGPNWVTAKDETGQRRLDNREDFVAIEIAAALTRNIPVVPVLVDGARMPKPSELPDSLKLLARRQAIQVRHTNFSSDAEALIKRLREALGFDSPESQWRIRGAIGVGAIAALLLIGWGGYALFGITEESQVAEERERNAAAIQAKLKDEAEETKRKVDAERQRKEGEEAGRAGDYAKAMANLNEAIRLNPNVAVAYYDRGLTYANIGDPERAFADFNEAIRLNPRLAAAFRQRGILYGRKGDADKALADYNEAIRLNPVYSLAFNSRGYAYQLRGDYDRAMADYNEAIRLDPKSAVAFCNRGMLKRKINDSTGDTDVAEAKKLDTSACK